MNSLKKEVIATQETGTMNEKAYWEGYYRSKAKETEERVDT